MISPSNLLILVLFCGSLAHAQQSSPTHARDTSSFFSVGFYTYYICRGMPPFSYDPITQYPPVREDIVRWVQRDSSNIADVHGNYFVDWIPHVYWHMVDPGPPIVRDHQPFEDDVFRDFAVRNNFRMDYKNNNPWQNTPDDPPSIQRFMQQLPQEHPPATAGDEVDWQGWKDSVYSELLRIRDTVMNSSIRLSPYQTFYAAHEVDVHPDLRDNHGEVSVPGNASRYALQFVCAAWDELYSGTIVKPFVVLNALDRWPLLLEAIAATCKNLRMVAMDSYLIDPYVFTAHELPEGEPVYRRGQKEVFEILADRMTLSWETFERNVPFDREKEGLPIERWFIGQVHKNFAVDSSGWALSNADFDWDNQHATRQHQNGSATRYPTYEEIRLQASLALSRGFKGIVWYTFGSANEKHPYKDFPFGVVDSLRRPITHDLDIGMLPEHPCASSVNPFQSTARVNEELHTIGPLFRKLRLEHVFDQASIPQNCMGLQSVTTEGRYGEEAVDISVFRRYDCDTCWYIMLVNKILNDTNNPCSVAPAKTVQIAFKSEVLFSMTEQPFGTPLDALNGGGSTLRVFRTEIAPGQGKIIEIIGLGCTEFTPQIFPTDFKVACLPSPLGSTGELHIELPEDGWVDIQLFDVLGRLVRDFGVRNMQAGERVVPLSGFDTLSPGSYVFRVSTQGRHAWTKVTIVR